ncbi:unnamed protein product, partial [Peniophora sp. CBMAI 1063]
MLLRFHTRQSRLLFDLNWSYIGAARLLSESDARSQPFALVRALTVASIRQEDSLTSTTHHAALRWSSTTVSPGLLPTANTMTVETVRRSARQQAQEAKEQGVTLRGPAYVGICAAWTGDDDEDAIKKRVTSAPEPARTRRWTKTPSSLKACWKSARMGQPYRFPDPGQGLLDWAFEADVAAAISSGSSSSSPAPEPMSPPSSALTHDFLRSAVANETLASSRALSRPRQLAPASYVHYNTTQTKIMECYASTMFDILTPGRAGTASVAHNRRLGFPSPSPSPSPSSPTTARLAVACRTMADEPTTTEGHVVGTPDDLFNARYRFLKSLGLDDDDVAEQEFGLYQKTRDTVHLENAIALFQRAVDAAPQDARLLSWLGHCLDMDYDARRIIGSLQRAVAAEQRAVQLTSDGHPQKAPRLHNLSISLRRRFQSLGAVDDLRVAIEMEEHAMELTPDDDPSMLASIDNLGSLRWLRFERFGELEDIEGAIVGRQRAAELTPDSHPYKPTLLHGLALSLRRRFEHLADLSDLARAVVIQEHTIALTPDGDSNLPVRLESLGSLQWLLFESFGELEDIESAIAYQDRAIELTPDGHIGQATRLHNLALFLRARYERFNDPADLERAITMQRRSVNLTPDGDPDLPVRLDNIASLLWLRFRRSGALEDIETSIAENKRSVKLTADGNPGKAIQLNNLAMSLELLFLRERTSELFSETFSSYMSANSQSFASPAIRLQSARYAVRLLDNNPEFQTAETLLCAHSRVLDVLSEVVWVGHTMDHRLEQSQKLGQLVSSAVCAAISIDAAAQAVEWLDAGRALIWTQTMSLRSPLHGLEQVRPDLARALEDVQRQLQNSINGSSSDDVAGFRDLNPDADVHRHSSDRHRFLAIKHGKLLADVRRLPGFESFLLPKKLSALLPSTTPLSGPAVFINVDRTRCDALILLPDGRITALALPELSLVKTEALRTQWQAYLKQENVRERALLAPHHPRSNGTSSPHAILDRLWRWIVGPVLKALEMDLVNEDRDRLPHVTWCPTGPLTQLPLHAAGIYEDDSGPRVYNFVVSSYTPSLSALARSINALTLSTTPGVLVVTQPDTPGLTPLPGTTLEGARLHEVFTASQTPSMALNGNEATTAAVKLALKEHSWLHLACHGCQEIDDPLKSAFALYDGRLSLSDLMVTTADNAELAFLSACQT